MLLTRIKHQGRGYTQRFPQRYLKRDGIRHLGIAPVQ